MPTTAWSSTCKPTSGFRECPSAIQASASSTLDWPVAAWTTSALVTPYPHAPLTGWREVNSFSITFLALAFGFVSQYLPPGCSRRAGGKRPWGVRERTGADLTQNVPLGRESRGPECKFLGTGE